MAMDALREAIKRKRMNLTENPEAALGDYEDDYAESLSPEEQQELEEYLSEIGLDGELGAMNEDEGSELEIEIAMKDGEDDMGDMGEMADKEENESYGMSPAVDDKDEDETVMNALYDKSALGKPGLRAKVAELIKSKRA